MLLYILVWYMSAILYYIIYAVWLCSHRRHFIRLPIVACIVTALYIVYILCTVYVYVTSCVHELDCCCVCVYQHYMHYIYCTYVYICCMLCHTPLYAMTDVYSVSIAVCHVDGYARQPSRTLTAQLRPTRAWPRTRCSCSPPDGASTRGRDLLRGAPLGPLRSAAAVRPASHAYCWLRYYPLNSVVATSLLPFYCVRDRVVYPAGTPALRSPLWPHALAVYMSAVSIAPRGGRCRHHHPTLWVPYAHPLIWRRCRLPAGFSLSCLACVREALWPTRCGTSDTEVPHLWALCDVDMFIYILSYPSWYVP